MLKANTSRHPSIYYEIIQLSANFNFRLNCLQLLPPFHSSRKTNDVSEKNQNKLNARFQIAYYLKRRLNSRRHLFSGVGEKVLIQDIPNKKN